MLIIVILKIEIYNFLEYKIDPQYSKDNFIELFLSLIDKKYLYIF